MIYRKFKDLSLSALGLGMMRLPVINGNDSEIDENEAAKMIDLAYRSGIRISEIMSNFSGMIGM